LVERGRKKGEEKGKTDRRELFRATNRGRNAALRSRRYKFHSKGPAGGAGYFSIEQGGKKAISCLRTPRKNREGFERKRVPKSYRNSDREGKGNAEQEDQGVRTKEKSSRDPSTNVSGGRRDPEKEELNAWHV